MYNIPCNVFLCVCACVHLPACLRASEYTSICQFDNSSQFYEVFISPFYETLHWTLDIQPVVPSVYWFAKVTIDVSSAALNAINVVRYIFTGYHNASFCILNEIAH